ncbi:MAG: hypothetical protein AAGJ18_14385 [Bacteroidota bacterium]
MKNIFFLSMLLFVSCNKAEDFSIPYLYENCDYLLDYSTPQTYTLQELSTITANVNLKNIQFVSEKVGYLHAGNNVGGYGEIFKTEDGGQNWQDLSLDLTETSLSMLFINEQMGLLTHYGGKGNLWRTEDGGTTWQSQSFDNLNGHLYHLSQDENGHIYAITSDLNSPATIVKSVDSGMSWTIFKEGLAIDFSLIRSGFFLLSNKVYVTVEGGQLLMLNNTGNIEKTIETGLSRFWDIQLIDGQHFVMVGDGQVIRTNNGGQSWQQIHDRTARIINFSSPQKGWMLLNKSNCFTDVYQVNDVLAYTHDGGSTWEESEERTNWMLHFNGYHQMVGNDYLIVFDKSIFRLK